MNKAEETTTNSEVMSFCSNPYTSNPGNAHDNLVTKVLNTKYTKAEEVAFQNLIATIFPEKVPNKKPRKYPSIKRDGKIRTPIIEVA